MSDREEIKRVANEICNISCPILDIGNREGGTGYIDFIQSDEFSEPFNKGVDKHGRKFITFRAIIEYADGSLYQTFTTLFQRYYGSEYLWVGGGVNPHLFHTYGGATLEQVNLLYKLLTEKNVDITEEMHDSCRIVPYRYTWDKPDNNKSKKVYLVSKEEVTKLNLSTYYS